MRGDVFRSGLVGVRGWASGVDEVRVVEWLCVDTDRWTDR